MITLDLNNQSGSKQMTSDKGMSESPFVHSADGSDKVLYYPHFNITYEGNE